MRVARPLKELAVPGLLLVGLALAPSLAASLPETSANAVGAASVGAVSAAKKEAPGDSARRAGAYCRLTGCRERPANPAASLAGFGLAVGAAAWVSRRRRAD